MVMRDRRGPLAAIVLTACYLAFILDGVLRAMELGGGFSPPPLSARVMTILTICLDILVWRIAVRSYFTAREYGWTEGLRAAPRIVVGNLVAIVSGRDALEAYVRSLLGGRVTWDKTEHKRHPALSIAP